YKSDSYNVTLSKDVRILLDFGKKIKSYFYVFPLFPFPRNKTESKKYISDPFIFLKYSKFLLNYPIASYIMKTVKSTNFILLAAKEGTRTWIFRKFV
ncbi:MAG: hypothetical protein IJE87_07605, partial [Firmicutes bacterium]|nr:hypothetical protein [Bacillota bacterium]